MQLTIGNRITTDGLVFCYDQNKALTETEIKINFEFIRWRYGL